MRKTSDRVAGGVGAVLLGLFLLTGLAGPGQAAQVLGSFDTIAAFGASDGPEGIALGDQGNLWLVASGQPVVQVTSTGAVVSSFDSGLSSLEGIVRTGSNLLVSNSVDAASGGGLYEFTQAGAQVGSVQVVDPPSADPDGVALGPMGSTLVADDGDESIYFFDSAGMLTATILTTAALGIEVDEPEGIAFDPVSGEIFVADDSSGTGSIYRISTTGTVLDSFVLPGFDDPEGLAFDAVNRILWVADDNNGAVIQVDPFAAPEPSVGLLLLVAAAVWRRWAVHRSS